MAFAQPGAGSAAPEEGEAQRARALQLLAQGEPEPAVALLTALSEAAPEDGALRFELAYALYEAGHVAAASAEAAAAARLAPSSQDAAYLWGVTAARRGDTAAARVAFERCVALDPASPLGRSASRHLAQAAAVPVEAALQRGLRALEAGELAQAVAFFHRAEAEAPQALLPRYYQGYAWYRLGRWSEAAAAFRAGLRLAPGDPWSRYMLALVLAHQGATAEARATLAGLDAAEVPPELRAAAARALAELERGRPVPSALARAAWQGSAALGLILDDNPRAEGPADQDGGELGLGLDLRVGRDLVQGPRAGLAVEAQVEGQGLGSWTSTPAALLGTTAVQGSWAPAARLRLRAALVGGAAFSGASLAAGQGLARLGAAWPLGRRGAVGLDAWLQRRVAASAEFVHLESTGAGGELSLSSTPRSWGPLRPWFWAAYRGERVYGAPLEQRDTWSEPGVAGRPIEGSTQWQWESTQVAHGPELALGLRGPGGAELSVWGRLTWHRYDLPEELVWTGPQGEESWEGERRDVCWRWGASLLVPLPGVLFLRLSAEGVRNESELGDEPTDLLDRRFRRQVYGLWLGARRS